MVDCPFRDIRRMSRHGVRYVEQVCSIGDSGPMHMACALDVPTLAVMGPTRTEMFGPWATHRRIIRNSLPCVPCKYENTNLCRHFSCIRSISVDSVYRNVVEMLRYCV